MTDITDGERDREEQLAAHGEALKEAWSRTLEDMEALAEQRREEGWAVVSIPAGDTTAVGRDAGDDDLFGIVHVIADNHAEEFAEAFAAGEFPRYEAYQRELHGNVFLVTEFLDEASGTCVMLAGVYERRNVTAAVRAAQDEGALFTHVETLDGRLLGSFRHERYGPLVPSPDDLPVDDGGE